MVKLSSKQAVLSMCETNKPVARVKSGETVVFETLDCFSNKIQTESQLFNSVGWADINPATGPLFVDGAEAGDTLKVEILDIKLDDWAVTADAPGHGVFGHMWDKEVTKIMPVKDGKVYFNDKIQLDIKPMIGVIGTAPANGQDIPTGTPGPHGGNMDCKEICQGTTLYLPVNTEGGLLAMGDMHAVMADGEVSVCGIEISGQITVRVTVIKNSELPMPFLVNDSYVMTIYSASTLDEAAKGTAAQMLRFATENLGIEPHEAAMLLSAAADLRICQIVDPLMTCRMELPLWITEKYGYKFS